jgi:hypothetical protein
MKRDSDLYHGQTEDDEEHQELILYRVGRCWLQFLASLPSLGPLNPTQSSLGVLQEIVGGLADKTLVVAHSV